jgi:hypothetical protein
MEAGELSRARVAGRWGVHPRAADDFGLEKTTAGCRLRNDSCDNLGELAVDTTYLNDDGENRLTRVEDDTYGSFRSDFVYDGLSRIRKRLDYVWQSSGTAPGQPLNPAGQWVLTNTVRG